jgi:hypothetical protein
MKFTTEAATALKKRIEKNRDKLFTFLDYDGVPWNNNNAEHAVKAFTRVRNGIFHSTPKGHREYAILLTIQQTLKYRGMDFLDFLRSGRMEIDGSVVRGSAHLGSLPSTAVANMSGIVDADHQTDEEAVRGG